MRFCMLGIIVSFLIGAPALAENPASQARAHFERAERHYALSEFDKAATEYKEAFRLRQEPALLFNLAQCHRQLGDHKRAVFYLKQYLLRAPAGPNRTLAEQLLRDETAKLEPAGPPDVEASVPSLDEIDPESLRGKLLCVFPFIQAEAGGSDAARSKYQESLQQVFYDVAKESPVLKDPLFLKRPPACGYRDTNCIAGIGAFSHCENVLVGSSTPVDNGFLLSVRLIDVPNKKVAARVDEVVIAEKEEQIAAWAEGHACRALKVECKGEVVLDLDRPDMVAVINRKPLVRKAPPAGGPEKITLPAGLHTVRVSIGRRSSLERPMVIRRNAEPARVSARQLADCAIPVTIGGELKNELPQPASVECRGANTPRIVGMALAGAGVIAAGIGGWQGMQAKSGENEVRKNANAHNGILSATDVNRIQSAQSQAKTANLLYAAGALLVAGGAVLYFVFGSEK